MKEGWIKLHRKIEEHWLYPKNREFTEYEAWQDILLQVNHKSRQVRIKNRVLDCKRGQSVRSIKEWAARWSWTRAKVYRFLALLQDDNMIVTESETVTTRLTVCNYDSYQQSRNADETQMKRKRNAGETGAYTNKNEKNEKNTTRARGFSQKLQEAESKEDLLLVWEEYRRSKNKFMTSFEQDAILNSEWDKRSIPEIKSAIVNSVTNGWLTLVWPEKDKQESRVLDGGVF